MNFKNLFYQIFHWETWNYLVKYIPISPVWVYYALKSKAVWWFTPSNPSITFGGFEGELKSEMYKQLPFHTYPKTTYIKPSLPFNLVKDKVRLNNFSYPLAVKPDAGMMGFMFRIIRDEQHLRQYHDIMKAEYIIQEMIAYPIEVSVFYYRMPGETCGTITGFLRKELLQVKGDGKRTLNDLIDNYKRATFKVNEIKSKNKVRLAEIIPENETVVLSQALNLSRGGKLVSLAHEIDDKLLKVFDELSIYSKNFYYGRYDIKCNSIEDLKEGKNYYILEFNGAGAEPHHIYGNHNTLLSAYGIVINHWRALYKISGKNHKMGVPYWSFNRGRVFLSNAKKHFKALKKLDSHFEY
ncbi:MAG: hypothetical protein NVS3B19_15130 [Ginsengibacter sp.]